MSAFRTHLEERAASGDLAMAAEPSSSALTADANGVKVKTAGGVSSYLGGVDLSVQVLTTGAPDETEFRQKLDALNFMMRDNHIEKATRLRVRHFYRMSKTMLKRRTRHRLERPTCCSAAALPLPR